VLHIILQNICILSLQWSYLDLKGWFQNLAHAINCQVEIKNAIPSLYTEVREDLEKQLSQHATYFPVTTGMWTSGSTDTYISVTIHYIDNNWELHSYCLTTTYLSDDHSGENIKQSLLDTLSEWNLDPSHLVAITTDSGSNIKRACLLLPWTRISCFWA